MCGPHPGMLLGGRFRLGEELARTEDAVIFRAFDELDSPPARYRVVAVTVFTSRACAKIRNSTLALVPPEALGAKRRHYIRIGDIVLTKSGRQDGFYFEPWCLWRDGDLPPRRRRTKPGFDRLTQRELLRAADGRCRWCGSTRFLECDHIMPLSLGGSNTLSNGQVLCRGCHRAKTLAEPKVNIYQRSPSYMGGEDPEWPWSARLHWASITGWHRDGESNFARRVTVKTLGPFSNQEDASAAGLALAIKRQLGLRRAIAVDSTEVDDCIVAVTVAGRIRGAKSQRVTPAANSVLEPVSVGD